MSIITKVFSFFMSLLLTLLGTTGLTGFPKGESAARGGVYYRGKRCNDGSCGRVAS